MTEHPITPPHDQVYWWWEKACKRPPSSFYEKLDYVAAKAAQCGADQELDACCEWLISKGSVYATQLRAARRPKPKPSPAAALRAAIDQAIPEEPLHGGDQRWMYERDARQSCRKKLLAIADELEGQA